MADLKLKPEVSPQVGKLLIARRKELLRDLAELERDCFEPATPSSPEGKTQGEDECSRSSGHHFHGGECIYCLERESATPPHPDARDALVRELVEKMQGVLRWFPTDQDMNELGWTARDINEACNAYDAGQAALSKVSDEMKEDPQ